VGVPAALAVIAFVQPAATILLGLIVGLLCVACLVKPLRILGLRSRKTALYSLLLTGVALLVAGGVEVEKMRTERPEEYAKFEAEREESRRASEARRESDRAALEPRHAASEVRRAAEKGLNVYVSGTAARGTCLAISWSGESSSFDISTAPGVHKAPRGTTILSCTAQKELENGATLRLEIRRDGKTEQSAESSHPFGVVSVAVN
jgi:hypothetical protein